MKIIIHIGKNKVGSSSLQECLVQNRDLLLEQGCFYPSHITPDGHHFGSVGNALKVAIYLRDNRPDRIESFFRDVIKKAIANNCDCVCLSNESIFHYITTQDKFDQFLSLLKACGFTEIQLLLFNRDLFVHSVSCFKHRIGEVVFKTYEDWLWAGEYEGITQHYEIASLDVNKWRPFIDLRIVEMSGDIVKDFELASGLNLQASRSIRVNSSISESQSFLLARAAEHDFFRVIRLKWRFKKNVFLTRSRVNKLLDKKVLKHYSFVFNNYVEGNRSGESPSAVMRLNKWADKRLPLIGLPLLSYSEIKHVGKVIVKVFLSRLTNPIDRR